VENNDLKEKEQPMIFRDVLKSDLPAEEKTIDRLWHDAQTFNIAGTETTAWTLGLLTYYLLANPKLLTRLQTELSTVVKDGRVEEASTAELEQLPYLVNFSFHA
jgi:cytochrome P450